jgi:outer membrane protein TolC
MFMVNGVDTFSTGVSTTLPFFSARRRKALLAATGAEVSASEATRRAIGRRVEGELAEAAAAAETAGRHERLHASRLIPLADQALAAAEAAYRSDQLDLSRVLSAARVVRDHHLEHARYRIEYERQVARVERLLGRPLPRREVP